jgi:hypothetical protein
MLRSLVCSLAYQQHRRDALSWAEMKTRTAYWVMIFANAAYLRQNHGEAFCRTFRSAADDKLRELIPRIPDRGDSVASMSYEFITAFVPLFHAFKQFDESRDLAGELLWVMNESLLQRFPSAIRRLLGRIATSKTVLRALRTAQLKGEKGLLHPLDWRVMIEEPAEGGCRTTWTQCGALQALRAIGEDGVFPYACRIDYLNESIYHFKPIAEPVSSSSQGAYKPVSTLTRLALRRRP